MKPSEYNLTARQIALATGTKSAEEATAAIEDALNKARATALSEARPFAQHLPSCNINGPWDEAFDALSDQSDWMPEHEYSEAYNDLIQRRNKCTCGLNELFTPESKKEAIQPETEQPAGVPFKLPNEDLRRGAEAKIDLSGPRTLYDKVINVEEYYKPGIGWTSLLADGRNLKESDMYYQFGVEYVVLLCIQQGATQIQFRCSKEGLIGKYGYPDYRVEELWKRGAGPLPEIQTKKQ